MYKQAYLYQPLLIKNLFIHVQEKIEKLQQSSRRKLSIFLFNSYIYIYIYIYELFKSLVDFCFSMCFLGKGNVILQYHLTQANNDRILEYLQTLQWLDIARQRIYIHNIGRFSYFLLQHDIFLEVLLL